MVMPAPEADGAGDAPVADALALGATVGVAVGAAVGVGDAVGVAVGTGVGAISEGNVCGAAEHPATSTVRTLDAKIRR